MTRPDKLKLGTFVYTFGFHPAAWLHPDSDVRGANDLGHLTRCAKISEAAKLDFMFFADSPASAVGEAGALARNPTKMNRFEPITAITALSQHTDRLGFVATASTSYYEPYNIARLFASADHISRGRIAWNVVTSDHDETGYNYNREGLAPHAERYERGEEFLDTVFGLWDSFEDDALLLDRESGVYHDKDKLHTLDHKGKPGSREPGGCRDSARRSRLRCPTLRPPHNPRTRCARVDAAARPAPLPDGRPTP